MSDKTNLLLILRIDQVRRQQYYDGIVKAFPQLCVNVVANVSDVDSYLPQTDIIITHGPYLETKADFVFANAPRLKWVQGTGTGVDNIADREGLRRDVIVTNVHGVHGAPMSEAAVALMLALSRKLQRSFNNQKMRHWENWSSRLLSGKTVGILGVGSIAETMGPLLKAFDMSVVGLSSGIREIEGFDRIVDKAALYEVVGEFDYLIVLTPYTPETRNMIDGRVFSNMKPDSFLINLARGGVVDEAALLSALLEKKIAGAALDVFSIEPLPSASPLWDLENVIVTCHQAATHENSAKNNLPTIEFNIGRFLEGDFSGMRNVIKRAD